MQFQEMVFFVVFRYEKLRNSYWLWCSMVPTTVVMDFASRFLFSFAFLRLWEWQSQRDCHMSFLQSKLTEKFIQKSNFADNSMSGSCVSFKIVVNKCCNARIDSYFDFVLWTCTFAQNHEFIATPNAKIGLTKNTFI